MVVNAIKTFRKMKRLVEYRKNFSRMGKPDIQFEKKLVHYLMD